MTSVAVPRKAKEAIGAIARLEPDGSVPGQRAVTINVEYNQLDPMLRASRDYPDGDVNDASGSSPFPGNINELVVALPMYVDVLEATGGVIGEFVNPKYKDETRKAFKKSTRLECMMQDLPKSFPESAKVGFVSLPTWLAFSPVKNSPEEAVAKVAAGTPSHSATSSELEVYERNCRLLEIAGAATVGEPKEGTFNGIACRVYPMVSVAPSFALTIEQLRTRVSGLSLAPGSALVLEGDASLRDCKVDGALVVRALAGARVSVEGVEVRNGGWSLVPVDSKDPSHPEEALIRGFHVEKKGVREEAHTASAEVRG